LKSAAAAPLGFLLVLSFLAGVFPAAGATITVNGDGDTVAVDGLCTLREALTAANTNVPVGDCVAGSPSLDTILFNIPSGDGHISIATPLPALIEPTVIDATGQPQFSPVVHGPQIVLSGAAADPGISGLTIGATAGGSTIRGLSIIRFTVNGISVLSSGNLIENNWLGLYPDDPVSSQDGIVSAPNGNGIGIIGMGAGASASNNLVRQNWIGSNTEAGVMILSAAGGTAAANLVQGNRIGFIDTFIVRPNRDGIVVQDAVGNVIGGLGPGENNEICSNREWGIRLVGADDTRIQGNQIGDLTAAGNTLGGILLISSPAGPPDGNTIGASTSGGVGGNTFLNNAQGAPAIGTAVTVQSGTGNRISTNAMGRNRSLLTGMGQPIDLGGDGPTPNDSCDSDSGANDLQNPPRLTSALITSTSTVVSGTLESTASSTFIVELFRTDQPFDASFLGSTTVTTAAGCSTNFRATLPRVAPENHTGIVAVAIAANGDTSEFSAAVPSTLPLGVTKRFNTLINLGETSLLTITITNPDAFTRSNLAFTDTYPAGLVNASPALATTTCSGGTLTAMPGGNSLSLSGGSIQANDRCTVTVQVLPTALGRFVNTIPAGAVMADGTASATDAQDSVLAIPFPPPLVSKAFLAATASPNVPVRLVVTLSNPFGTDIFGTAFVDSYPINLINATPANAVSTCGGAITAASGGSSLALSNGTIPASAACTVSVDVLVSGFVTNVLPDGAVTSSNASPSVGVASASIGPPAAIPTAGVPTTDARGLVALIALLTLVGLVVIRAR
jgi:CSLREA domain-containing protein